MGRGRRSSNTHAQMKRRLPFKAFIEHEEVFRKADQAEAKIASLPPEGQRRYGDQLRGFVKLMLKQETGGSSPEVVAQAVLDALRAKEPPARPPAGW